MNEGLSYVQWSWTSMTGDGGHFMRCHTFQPSCHWCKIQISKNCHVTRVSSFINNNCGVPRAYYRSCWTLAFYSLFLALLWHQAAMIFHLGLDAQLGPNAKCFPNLHKWNRALKLELTLDISLDKKKLVI